MTFHIIIRGKNKYGRTRTEQEANLRKDGFSGMSDENYDKCQYVEKKLGIKDSFVRQAGLEDAK